MPLKFGSNDVDLVVYNNSFVETVVCDGITVYQNQTPLTYTLQYDGTSYYYSVSRNTAVTPSGAIVIPESIGDKQVRKLDEAIFKNCTSITSVTIPKYVTTVPKEAFYGCTALTTVNGCQGVKVIDEAAFRNCRALTSYRFTVALTAVEDYAFLNCYKLNIETGLYDTSINYIERYAFAIWDSGVTPSGRTNVSLPETIRNLYPYSFTNVSFMSLPYPSTWNYSEYDETDGEYYDGTWSIKSTTSTAAIANSICADCYYERTDVITTPIVTLDTEGSTISVGVTNPLSVSGSMTISLYYGTQTSPTVFTFISSSQYTIKANETLTAYFTDANYYTIKVVVTIAGCSSSTEIVETNEDYEAPPATT